MFQANDLDKAVLDLISETDFWPVQNHLGLVAEGQRNEVNNTSGRANLYYKYLHCLMLLLKPAQVVELGAAAGISTTLMATALPLESKLISVDVDPIAWRWMDRDYPQVIKILGDDLDLSIYPEDIKLDQTDIWFIDSLHTGEQLRREVDLYTPFWKKGAVLLFDDIHINEGMKEVWDSLPYDKLENPQLHWSNFGVCVV